MTATRVESPRAARLRAIAWRPTPAFAAIAAVALLGGLLRLLSLGGQPTNAFYDAAVRSMGESWHNFFYAAFDPGGATAIDKPPLDLWLQVLSVKLFGFGPLALILPQAIAATLAIPLLYDLVRRLFGVPAALAAALSLAVLPVSVVTARSDTMDSLMMALNVLSAWLIVRSVETGRRSLLLWAGVVIGLNFEVKLFEALFALPALVALYLLASRLPSRRRIGWLAAALAIALVTALAWPAIVSLTPRGSRPYPIGSSDGTVWNAIFVFNGTQRLNPPPGSVAAALPPLAVATPEAALLSGLHSSGDAPSALRLFELRGFRYGQDFGIELAGAFAFGALALLVAAIGGLGELTAARRLGRAPPSLARVPPLQLGATVAIALWVLIGFALFSHQHGVLRTRYLEALAPGVAAALGVGVTVCVRNALRSVWALGGLAVAVLVVALYALDVAGGDTAVRAASAVAAIAGVAATAAAAFATRRAHAAASALALAAGLLCLATVLAPSLGRSLRLVRAHASDAGTTARLSNQRARQIGDYLAPRTRGMRWQAASYSYQQAAPLIVRDGRPVLVLTSFHNELVSPSRLASEIARGRMRYALIGGHCGYDPLPRIGDCPRIVRWLRARSVDVTRAAGIDDRGVLLRLGG